MSETGRDHISRRDALRATGLAVGTALGVGVPSDFRAQEAADAVLTADEYATLDAVAARIIPSDADRPGAREAMAVRFIDRALAGPLADSLPQYREGIAALDRAARTRHDGDFVLLSEADQDTLLAAAQDGEIEDFPASAQFFNMVRTHTIQGTFSDPIYGGNANFAGWDTIGYPGVRVAVPERYQQMDADHPPNHASAYDSGMFDRPEGVTGADEGEE